VVRTTVQEAWSTIKQLTAHSVDTDGHHWLIPGVDGWRVAIMLKGLILPKPSVSMGKAGGGCSGSIFYGDHGFGTW
jgi:hypothetical protein